MESTTPPRMLIGPDDGHEECNPEWFIVPEHFTQGTFCSGSNTLCPETKLITAIDQKDRRYGTTSAPLKMVCDVCSKELVVFEL